MPTRRDVLGTVGGLAGAACLPRPGLAATTTVLNFIPQSDIAGLDPIWSTQTAARNHGYLVFDTLFATDADLRIRPQMAEGMAVDGLVSTIRLRPGLLFHDNTPVLARDCVASIRRWASRDPMGRLLMAATVELTAPDDRTIRFRFSRPFPSLGYTLGKLSTPLPFMMPERLAATPAITQVTEAVGSGPFRFVQDEWVQGSHLAYARFDGYLPRDEPPSGTAGGKKVNVDRVVWTIMPDNNTAASALQTGAADWFEWPPQDLMPLLERSPGIRTQQFDRLGFITVGRMNQLRPPFSNPKVRQAFATAVDQRTFMEAAVGDPQFFRECRSFLPCGSPWSAEQATQIGGGLERGRRLLAESGYDGSKAVVLSTNDNTTLSGCAAVAFDLMQKLGMQAELVDTDVAGLMRRRVSQEPTGAGGWSFFVTTSGALGASNPADFAWLQANGTSGPPGWPKDDVLQDLLGRFADTTTDDERRAVASSIEEQAARSLPFVPLGQYQQPTAYRSNVSNLVPAGAPVFWNLHKS